MANAGGSGNTYTVIVASGNSNGGLRLDVIDVDSIRTRPALRSAEKALAMAISPTASLHLDKTAPVVTGSLRADTNPTTTDNVNFTIVFSEAVTGDPSDFSLSTTGSISGAATPRSTVRAICIPSLPAPAR